MKELRRLLVNESVIQWMSAILLGVLLASSIYFLVKDILVPAVISIWGLKDISELSVNINQSRLLFGEVLNSFLRLVLGVLMIQILNAVSSKKRIDETLLGHGQMRKRSCTECLSLVPLEAKKCPFCTSELTPILSLRSGKVGS